MIQLWVVPVLVRFPDLKDFMPDDDWSDVWTVLTREDDKDPPTVGEFGVGNASRLADPTYFVAWWHLITAQHEKWREEAAK